MVRLLCALRNGASRFEGKKDTKQGRDSGTPWDAFKGKPKKTPLKQNEGENHHQCIVYLRMVIQIQSTILLVPRGLGVGFLGLPVKVTPSMGLSILQDFKEASIRVSGALDLGPYPFQPYKEDPPPHFNTFPRGFKVEKGRSGAKGWASGLATGTFGAKGFKKGLRVHLGLQVSSANQRAINMFRV